VLPSVAIQELENDTGHLVSTILAMRAFAHAKSTYDNAKSKLDLPRSRAIDLVQEIEFAAVRDEIDRARDPGGSDA
jgi:hypothetical protein